MNRPAMTWVLLALALSPTGCGREEPLVSREVTPIRPDHSAAPLTDPNATTRAPRAIATH